MKKLECIGSSVEVLLQLCLFLNHKLSSEFFWDAFFSLWEGLLWRATLESFGFALFSKLSFLESYFDLHVWHSEKRTSEISCYKKTLYWNKSYILLTTKGKGRLLGTTSMLGALVRIFGSISNIISSYSLRNCGQLICMKFNIPAKEKQNGLVYEQLRLFYLCPWKSRPCGLMLFILQALDYLPIMLFS